MLYAEVAIKPELLEPTIERLADLDGKFGFEKGALISRLPFYLWGQFKNDVTEKLIDGTSKESVYAEEILKRLQSAFIRFGRTDPKPESWLDDILRLHDIKPFSAIVSDCGREPAIPYYRLNQELGVFGEDKKTPKIASDFIDVISPLLHASKRIELIDPYFALDEKGIEGSQNKAFFDALFTELQARGQSKVVTFHIEADPSSRTALRVEEQKAKYEEYMSASAPDKVEVHCYWWDDNSTSAFHARYLLTEKGAVKFDSGFRQPVDHDQRRQPIDMSVVKSEDTLMRIRSQFDEFETEMTLVDRLIVNEQ